MYETAALMKEMRAECPEWTRDRWMATSKPAARKTPVPAAKKATEHVVKKAAAPVVKRAAAPVARKSSSRISANAILASFRDTLEKTERDIIRHKKRLDQLESDIRAMQRSFVPANSTLLIQMKKDREEVRRKIEKLQGIRDMCRKQLGMK